MHLVAVEWPVQSGCPTDQKTMLRPLSNHWHRPLLFFHSAPEEIIGLDAPRSMCDDGKTRTTGRRRIYEHDSLCRDMYTVDAHARRHTQSLRPTTRSRTKKRITRRDNRIEERESSDEKERSARQLFPTTAVAHRQKLENAIPLDRTLQLIAVSAGCASLPSANSTQTSVDTRSSSDSF